MLGDEVHIEIDRVSEHQWSDVCLQFRDATINQTWAFGAVMSGERGLSQVVVRRNGSVMAAVQVRLVTVPVLKVGIGYVGWGPMWRKRGCDDDIENLRHILKALKREYAQRRGVLLRVQPNVFDDCPDAAAVGSLFAEAGFTRNESPHHTLFLELAPSLEELRQQLHRKWRNHLNKAEKTGIQLKEGTDGSLFDEFRDLYHEMRQRKGYSDGVDIDKYAAVQSRLPEVLKCWIIVAEVDSVPAAGAVFSTVGDAGIYLLGATNERGMQSNASYAIQWRIIQWLKEKGYRCYDLGGVDPDKVPTTYHFKSRICGAEPTICTRIGEFTACESVLSRLAVGCGEMARSWKGRSRTRRGQLAESGASGQA
jgi:hypothetical protein